jgi:NTE family protein
MVRSPLLLSSGRPARTALVLGAGGTVGLAFHAGALRALEEAGVDPTGADLMIGTSAGAVVSATLRAGHPVASLWEMAHDRHPVRPGEPAFSPEIVYRRGWRTPIGLGRRLVGSSWVLARSLVRWPPMNPPAAAQRWWRAGVASITEQRAEMEQWTGAEWPDRDVWLVTVDIVGGRRVVLGQPGGPRPPIVDAVRASAAVPGLYPPVRVGRRMLVDGGVHSSTNADLAVAAGARAIIVVAPMASDPDDPPPLHLRAARAFFERRLDDEVARARDAGVRVVVVRPTAEECRVHGLALLRTGHHGAEADLAHATATTAFATDEGRDAIAAWREQAPVA